MGTYVFPRAKHKFYLDATVAERAKRRFLQNKREADIPLFRMLKASFAEGTAATRFARRTLFTPPPDAVMIDTTRMSAER